MNQTFEEMLFTPRPVPQTEFDLLRHFELCPPNFAPLKKEQENLCEDVSQDFDIVERKEPSGDQSVRLRSPSSAFTLVKNETSPKAPLKLRLKSKSGGNLPFLQFRNPTPSFSTRCDVIYKTLLRDCKRYFFEIFQMRKLRKHKRIYYLSKTLTNYVNQRFEHLSDEVKNELKIHIGCLVYPKEMASSKVIIHDASGSPIRGSERAKKLKKIKEIHTILYNFSMEK